MVDLLVCFTWMECPFFFLASPDSCCGCLYETFFSLTLINWPQNLIKKKKRQTITKEEEQPKGLHFHWLRQRINAERDLKSIQGQIYISLWSKINYCYYYYLNFTEMEGKDFDWWEILFSASQHDARRMCDYWKIKLILCPT